MKKNRIATTVALGLLISSASYSNVNNINNSVLEQPSFRHRAVKLDIGVEAAFTSNDSGWGGITAGAAYQYNFNRYVGIEGRLNEFWVVFIGGYQASLTAVATYPLSQHVDVFGKAGFGYMSIQDVFDYQVSSNGRAGVALGVGMGYHFNQALEMTLEYNGVLYGSSEREVDGSMVSAGAIMYGQFTLGLSYHF